MPLSESVLGLARLQQEGKIKLIGLSNITVKQLEEARSVAEIASVQNRSSVGECQEEPMVVYCAREGIAFVPYRLWEPIRGSMGRRLLPPKEVLEILANA